MFDKEDQKKLKQIEKGIDALKKKIKKAEFRPCHSDKELKEKEQDFLALRKRMFVLEDERLGVYRKGANGDKRS